MKKALISLLLISVLLLSACGQTTEKTVRKPMFAGSWYPEDKEELSATIDSYLSNVGKLNLNGTIKAVIVPHAGYEYSGQIAAAAFRQLEDIYENVFLLGPSHNYPLQKASILSVTHYATPLGEIRISDKAMHLLDENSIESIPEAHSNEHSLEIELPFLQKQLSDFGLITILVGKLDAETFKNVLMKYLGDDDLIVVSVDLSHYHTYGEAQELDAFAIQKILELDADDIFRAEIDAPWAVSALLRIAKEKKWKPALLHYANSGDITGDKSRVVGYTAIIFIDESVKKTSSKELNEEEKQILLNLARRKLESIYTGEKINMDALELTPKLKKVQGCFTTLNMGSHLRGCIGHILPQEELYKCILDNVENAALRDSRFQPVKEEELKDIEIEISVLSVPEKLEFTSGDNLKNKLTPNTDGVVLKKGFYQSTYLPQVWDQLPSKELFLSNLCIKAGLSEDCWKDTSTEVYTYQADVFDESEFN